MKLFCLFFAYNTYAETQMMLNDCGEYQASGIVRIVNNAPFIIINERTMSEYVLSIPINEEPKVAPFVNRHFTFTGTIEKKMNGTKGEIKLLKNLDLKVPNPLNGSKDSRLLKIKDITCKK
jgi:hypothetical protein